jgi:hypothetical protein
MVSEKALQEFKKIWIEEFGEEITDQKALDEATTLLSLFDAIYRPIKKEWLEEREGKDQDEHIHGTNQHHNRI